LIEKLLSGRKTWDWDVLINLSLDFVGGLQNLDFPVAIFCAVTTPSL